MVVSRRLSLLAVTATGLSFAAAPVPKADTGPLIVWTARVATEQPVWPVFLGGVVFTPDGKHLVAGGRDVGLRTDGKGDSGVVWVWDAATGERRHQFRSPVNSSGYWGDLAISPDGKLVAAGGDMDRWVVHVWAWGEVKPKLTLSGAKGRTFGLAFAADSRSLAGIDGAGVFITWDLTTGKPARADTAERAVGEMVFDPGRACVVGWERGGENPRLGLWDARTGKSLGAVPDSPHRESGSIALSRDGKTLATGTGTPEQVSVHLWTLSAPAGGRLTAGTHRTGSAKALRSNGLACTSPPSPISHWVSHLAFSPAGRLVAAVCSDRGLRLWDVTTGTLLAGVEDPDGAARFVAFSPDGRRLATTGGTTVRMWSVAELLKQTPK